MPYVKPQQHIKQSTSRASQPLFLLFLLVCICSLQLKMANAKPLVSVQKADSGDDRVMGVHLPWIYNMDMITGKNRGTKFNINVLSGLVQVQRSREKVNGRRPISVSVFGNRVYDSYPDQPSGVPDRYPEDPLYGQLETSNKQKAEPSLKAPTSGTST